MPNVNRFQMGLIKAIGIDDYLNEIQKKDVPTALISTQPGERFDALERKTWFMGNGHELEHFYKTQHHYKLYPGYAFWQVINTNQPRVHYPLASTISTAFGTLLFSEMPKFSVDEEYEDRLKTINETNDILSILQSSAQLQSYSGGVALKLNIDFSITDVPLITSYPKESYKEHKRYGQTIYIDFMDEYEDGYKLVSRYGRGYISYTLYHKDREVPLTAHELTRDLQDVAFSDSNGNLLPILFAAVVPNRAQERSDYHGLISSFHALDEVYSSMINYIRKTKPNTFISEDIAPKDAQGKPIPMNHFDNDITILDGTPEGLATSVQREVINLSITPYTEAFLALERAILSKVGISPGTLGIDGAGANASGEALNIRERASARSRSEKLAIWKEKLHEFIYAVLILDKAVSEGSFDNGVVVFDSQPEIDIKIDFGNFHEKSISEKVELYKTAVEAGLASIEFAIYQIFGEELSEDELQKLIVEAKLQKGLALTKEEQKLADLL